MLWRQVSLEVCPHLQAAVGSAGLEPALPLPLRTQGEVLSTSEPPFPRLSNGDHTFPASECGEVELS